MKNPSFPFPVAALAALLFAAGCDKALKATDAATAATPTGGAADEFLDAFQRR